MIHASKRDSWRELDAKLRQFVKRRVRSEADVDDVVQEVFLRMQRALPELRDDERFGPWVYRVARSAIGDHHRSLARRRIDERDWGDSSLSREPESIRMAESIRTAESIGMAESVASLESVQSLSSVRCESGEPLDLAHQESGLDASERSRAERELASYLTTVIATLPRRVREAITLVELEGMTQRLAADRAGLSLPAMKSRVQRGRALLRRLLERDCQITLDARGGVMACEPRPKRAPACQCGPERGHRDDSSGVHSPESDSV